MMPTSDCSTASCAHLCGRLLSADDLTEGAEEPLREVVVLRDPPAVHVFNVLEHGRRWYMELVFSSDADTALYTSLPTQVGLMPSYPLSSIAYPLVSRRLSSLNRFSSSLTGSRIWVRVRAKGRVGVALTRMKRQ